MADMADLADVVDSEAGLLDQIIHELALTLGFSDTTLRFFISILLCYPLALIPRNFLYHAPANVQHFVYILLGLFISYFNFGTQTIHYIVTILFNYLLLAVNGGTQTSVILSFVFNLSYFIVGTYSVSDGSHDILWDTPHCVMVLKVIGVAWDVYDGKQKSKEEMSQDQRMHFLSRPPTLLEMGGFCLFFAGFLAGPQFSMRRYLNYTNNGLIPEWEQKHPSNLLPAVNRFCFAGIYLAVGICLNMSFPDSNFMTDAFRDKSLLHKLFIVYLWGTAYRTRYGGIFLLSEGVSIITGIAYSGLDDHGNAQWKGGANMNVYGLETAVTFRQLVANYNINTSKWAARCIYKRCRFLGNRHMSQLITLMFLAFWHGIFIGYYHCFLCQLFTLVFEEQWQKVWRKLGLNFLWGNPITSFLMLAVCNVFVMTSFSYSLLSFQLCKWSQFTQVYASMYYVGHVWYIGWMILFPFVIQPLLGKQKPVDKNVAEAKAK